jgi:Na+-translocating ferredoxin:NAD+ oxidoreductase RnfD subunit
MLLTFWKQKKIVMPLSGLIAALSFTMLVSFVNGSTFLYVAGAVLIPIAKHFIQWRGRHLFNPSNFGVVMMLLLFPNLARITPAAWGTQMLLFLLFAIIGLRLVVKAKVWQITAWFFLTEIALFLAFRIVGFATVGDAVGTLIQTLCAPLMLIFSFFMITDPRTAPATFIGRIRYAQAIAILHYILQIAMPGEIALFFALFLVCGCRPLLITLHLSLD